MLLELCALLVISILALCLLGCPIVSKVRRRDRKGRREGLIEISNPENGAFDIIAVHGLGADPHFTWTATASGSTDSAETIRVHLLRDLLRKDFPNARILSFAHNSDWLFDAPVTSARQIGQQLLDRLKEDRSERPCVPIFFIGHSFGGIIIKKAFCSASSEDELELVDNTDGIIFLGTPHQGSSLSWLGIIAARITAILGSSTGLLLSLMSNKQDLTDLDLDFTKCMLEREKRRQKTRIVAFCEKRVTRVLGLSVGQIVHEDSARGGHGAASININKDHSGLNKCKAEHDELYIQLKEQLQTFIRLITKPALNGNQTFVIERLHTVEGAVLDSKANEHESICLEDTRSEVLREIEQWSEDPDQMHIYWLHGKAGTGKSTIARTIAHDLAIRTRLAASFFFKRDEADRSSMRYFFSTIATQLARSLPSTAKHVRSAIDAEPKIAEKRLGQQFKELFLKPLEDNDNPRPMTIVIDALDECQGDEDIATVIGLLNSDQLVATCVRVFITSRFEPPIDRGFKATKGRFIAKSLEQMTEATIKRDIEIFLRRRFEQIKRTYSYLSSPFRPTDEELQKLLGRSIPLFIFAATACRFIEDGRQGVGGPSARLQKLLDYKAHRALDQTYLPLLDQTIHGLDAESRDDALDDFKRIVGSIIVLRNPLSAASLANLFGICKDSVNNRLFLLHSVLEVPPDDTAGAVRIFHESFRDFLFNPKITTMTSGYSFWVDEKHTHEKLSERCLDLLTERLKRNICGLKGHGAKRDIVDQRNIQQRLSSEVQYACLYWVYHLACSGVKLDDAHPALCFLQRHFLHWLEALSLIGKASESIWLMKDLCALIRTNNSIDINELLNDAQRFVLANLSVIDRFPLQLYSSLLIFTPKTSRLRAAFQDQIPEWITLQPRVDRDWSQKLQTLEGHSKAVAAVAFSPDSTLIASAAYDHTVRLWRSETGECVQTLEGHGNRVITVAFSRDGTLIASASHDHTLRLWCASTGEFVRSVPIDLRATDRCGVSQNANAIEISLNNTLIAYASYNFSVQIQCIITGQKITRLRGHSCMISSVAFSPNGMLMASVDVGGTALLWRVRYGKFVQLFRDDSSRHSGSGFLGLIDAFSLAFSHDNKLVALVTDSTVRLWNTTTGEWVQALNGHSDGGISSAAFSPDSTLIAIASTYHTVRVYRVTAGECVQTFSGHSRPITSLAFSNDGELIASASADHTVGIWRATIAEPVQNHDTHDVQNHDTHDDAVSSVAVSPDGKLIASASHDHTLRLWRATTGDYVQTLQGSFNKITCLDFSPDSQLIASASGNGVDVWSAASGKCVRKLKDTRTSQLPNITSVMFSPDGMTIASASWGTKIKLWCTTTGDCEKTLEAETGGQHAQHASVAFSSNSMLIASASSDNTIRIWSATTGELIRKLKCNGAISAVFSADSMLIASVSSHGKIKLWRTETGEYVQTLKTRGKMYVSFDLDGRRLLTDHGAISICTLTNMDSTAIWRSGIGVSKNYRWVTWNGKGMLRLPKDFRPYCLRIVGNTIVIGSKSGRVFIMSLSPEKM